MIHFLPCCRIESKSEVQSPVTLEYSSAAKDEVVLDQFKVDSSH